LKVWLMNHYATNMFADKAGRHYWFAKKMKERKYEVTVFCAATFLNKDDVIDTNGKKFITDQTDNIPFVFVSTIPSQGNGMARVRNWFLFYKNLFPATKAYAKGHGKPDVIVASSVHPLTMVAGIQIAKRLKVPCICEVRDLWPEAIFQFGKSKEKSLIGRVLIMGEHWIYKKADALIFTKEGDTDYLKERKWTTVQGGDIDLDKCHYINNGIDLKVHEKRILTSQLKDLDLLDESKFNITYAGAIRPMNNVGNLLDTAAILKKKDGYEDVQFLIFGEGVQLAELKRRVKEEQLSNVKLKGFVNRRYMPYILSRSSINMLNYAQNQYNWTRGNSSNKLFEYMASGKPIISTVKMGYCILEKYQCGLSLEECTPEALAEMILKIHDMPEDTYAQMAENAQEGAKDFDFSVLTERLYKVIKRVGKG